MSKNRKKDGIDDRFDKNCTKNDEKIANNFYDVDWENYKSTVRPLDPQKKRSIQVNISQHYPFPKSEKCSQELMNKSQLVGESRNETVESLKRDPCLARYLYIRNNADKLSEGANIAKNIIKKPSGLLSVFDEALFIEESMENIETDSKYTQYKQKKSGKNKKIATNNFVEPLYLDLHGLNLKDAEHKLRSTVIDCFYHNEDMLIVISGKGDKRHKSYWGEKATIKAMMPYWLDSMSGQVKNYSQADKIDGGDGAWYIFLHKFFK